MCEESEDPVEFWNFIPLDQYSIPSDTITVGKVRKSFRNFIKKLLKKDNVKGSPLKPDDNLLNLSGDLLKSSLPRLDSMEGAVKLDERLKPWLESDAPSKPVIFYLAPPFSGRINLLTQWARNQGIPLVASPQHKEILGNYEKWFRSWPKENSWVLPNLEKCFLRQASGLDLVREILSRVLSGEFGRGVIGCDGWAWSFLQQVWLGRPSFTITTQAIDADMIKRFFHRSIFENPGCELRSFRRADNGAYLLNYSEKYPANSDNFWHNLVGYSRGNLGVATACWQRALKALPDEKLEDEANRSHREYKNTIWVTPWDDLILPAYPKDEGETALFVLHALLIHDGLDLETLANMLPSDRTGLTEVLLFLRESELVEEKNEQKGTVWRVTASGYPAVRKALSANDYFCDPF